MARGVDCADEHCCLVGVGFERVALTAQATCCQGTVETAIVEETAEDATQARGALEANRINQQALMKLNLLELKSGTRTLTIRRNDSTQLAKGFLVFVTTPKIRALPTRKGFSYPGKNRAKL